jgi:ABC-type sugar transport system substrate-binding protein
MNKRQGLLNIGLIVLVLAMVAFVVAACGGDSSTETTAATTATTAAAPTTTAASTENTVAPTDTTTASTGTTLDLAGYSGPDAPYLSAGLPEPAVQAGFEFTVGYLQPWAGASVLLAVETACQAETEALGGKFISYDATGNTEKQVSQMNTLISQKVDLVFAFPVSEASLTQGMAAANAAGIPVALINMPPSSETPVDPSAKAMVGMPFDYFAYTTMKYVADTMPGAKVAFVGYAPPAEQLIYLMKQANHWATEFGLTVLDQVDAVDDNPASAGVAAQAIIGKYPDVQVIIAYNDYSTMGVVAALKAAGKTDIVAANPNGGSEIAKAAIQDGSVLCTYRSPYELVGTTAARAAYNLLTEQNLPLPERFLMVGELVTKDNVDSVTFIK